MAVSFTIIYYINAHLPHAREFSAYARECITRKLSVASGPGQMFNMVTLFFIDRKVPVAATSLHTPGDDIDPNFSVYEDPKFSTFGVPVEDDGRPVGYPLSWIPT